MRIKNLKHAVGLSRAHFSETKISREDLRHAEEIVNECEALYVRGKFLKGDAKTFKKYGVAIL